MPSAAGEASSGVKATGGSSAGRPPRRIAATSPRLRAPAMTRSSTSAASRAHSRGTMRPAMPAWWAPWATASAPRQWRSSPVSDSSPKTAQRSSAPVGTCSDAASRPQAVARSNPGPTLRRCAGARFTVIRRCGNANPEFSSAACTRSRDSRTAASPRPTIVNAGRPLRRSTSTVIGREESPSMAKVATRASTGRTLGALVCRSAPIRHEMHVEGVTTSRSSSRRGISGQILRRVVAKTCCHGTRVRLASRP